MELKLKKPDFIDRIPFFGRKLSFKTALTILNLVTKGGPVNIVETGCIRSLDSNDLLGDGASSLIFSYYVNMFGGKLTTVDISQEHMEKCKEVTFAFSDYINYVVEDSVSFLENYKEPIDLLFLDSMDTDFTNKEIINRSCEHQLKEAKAVLKNLGLNSLILTDDYPRKTLLAEPFFIEHGFNRIYAMDDQALFSMINPQNIQ